MFYSKVNFSYSDCLYYETLKSDLEVSFSWTFWELWGLEVIEICSKHYWSMPTCALAAVPQISLKHCQVSAIKPCSFWSARSVQMTSWPGYLCKCEGSVPWFSMRLGFVTTDSFSFLWLQIYMTCFFLLTVTKTNELHFELLWRMTVYSIIHSFNRHLLSTFYVPDTLLVAVDTGVNQRGENSVLWNKWVSDLSYRVGFTWDIPKHTL